MKLLYIKVAAFDSEGKEIEVVTQLIKDKETDLNFKKDTLDRAVAFIPNYDDFCFVKVVLDIDSYKFFTNNFEKVSLNEVNTNILLKALVYCALDGIVRTD